MTDQTEITRLDRLWQAVAVTGADADWLRFYEGFAAQTLIVPVEDGDNDAVVRPKTLPLSSGKVALAFDTTGRFDSFITGPTNSITLTGAGLAAALNSSQTGVALNPGVAPGETMLDPEALDWIAKRSGAAVTTGNLPPGSQFFPSKQPEPALLEALGARIAEMEGYIVEAWLIGASEAEADETYLCVIRMAQPAGQIVDDIAAELTRIGQIRASRPFSVAVVEDDTRLLKTARRLGIGLGVG